MRRSIAAAVVVALVAAGIATIRAARTVEPQITEPAADAGRPHVRAARAANAPPDAVDARTQSDAPTDRHAVGGVVLDSRHEPIADAEVALYVQDTMRWVVVNRVGPEFAHLLTTTRTSSDGAFTASVPASAGEPLVLARKVGYAPVAVLGRDELVELTLRTASTCGFVVVDELGHPVPGAEISLLGDGASAIGANAVRDVVVTDAVGAARLEAEDEADVIVRAAGLATATYVSVRSATVETPLRIVMHEGRQIAGVVIDGAGKPIANATVGILLWSDRRSGCPEHHDRRQADADGSFVFDGLPPSAPMAYSVSADAPGRAEEYAEAFPGQTDLRFVLRRTATIRGVIDFRDGTPPKRLRDSWPRIGAKGRFELKDYRPGHQTIEAWARFENDDVEFRGAATVDALEGGVVEDVHITLAPTTSASYVLVRVLTKDGTPDRDAQVKAWRHEVNVGWGHMQEDGTCLAVVEAPAGSEVLISASGFGAAARDVTTSAEPPTEPVVLQLAAVGSLRIHLVAGDREIPFADAEIENGSPDPKRESDGMYPLRVDSSFWARIRVPGYAVKLVEFEPPNPPLREETVRLAPANRVVGRVVGADGRPAPDVSVRDEYSARNDDVVGRRPDPAGKFEIPSLPAGRTVIRVYARDDVVAFREVDVTSGGVDLGTITLSARRSLRFVAVDEQGRPLGGALASFLDPADGPICANTTSRPDGTFEALVAAVVPLRVLVQRYAFATRFVTATDDVEQPIRVVLTPAGAVRVRTSSAITVGTLRIEARAQASANRPWTPRTENDRPEGDITNVGVVYDDLPPGPVELTLVTPRRRYVRTVDVVAGETVDCVFDQ